jgi:hypothetical protein
MRRSFIPPLLLSLSAMAPQAPTTPPQGLAPNDLVRKVVTHELQADDQDHTHWMYREVTNLPPPSKTKTVIETTDGDLTYLDEIDGRPLTPDQKREEDQRVQSFVADTAQQRKARRAAEADDRKTSQLFTMLPDAFIFKLAESEAGPGANNVKLTFQPDPAFHPWSSDAYVFHKMEGYVVLNMREDRLVEISGVLTHGVEFAGGLLGHLDQGGTFDVRREEVAPTHWEITKLRVNMNGKVLFFKSINVQQDEVHSHFKQVPDGITLVQAENLLQKQLEERFSE